MLLSAYKIKAVCLREETYKFACLECMALHEIVILCAGNCPQNVMRQSTLQFVLLGHW